MGTVRRIHAHKFTACCTIPNCKYISKIPYTDNILNNKNSIFSKKCPKHRVDLIKKL